MLLPACVKQPVTAESCVCQACQFARFNGCCWQPAAGRCFPAVYACCRLSLTGVLLLSMHLQQMRAFLPGCFKQRCCCMQLVNHLQQIRACCQSCFKQCGCCLQLSGDYDSDGELPSSSASTRNKAKLGMKGGKKGRGDPSKPGPAVGGAAYRMSEWPPDTGPDGQLEARPDNVSPSAALHAPLCSTEPACNRACMDCCAASAFACLWLQHLQQIVQTKPA